MTLEQIVLAGLSLVLIPAVIAEVRYRSAQRTKFEELSDRIQKIESFIEFIQQYMLKRAVLEFHNNPNPDTDEIIEKINRGDNVTVDELRRLHDKVTRVKETTDDTKKHYRAQSTLDLMDQIFEWHESIKQQREKRNDLFNE